VNACDKRPKAAASSDMARVPPSAPPPSATPQLGWSAPGSLLSRGRAAPSRGCPSSPLGSTRPLAPLTSFPCLACPGKPWSGRSLQPRQAALQTCFFIKPGLSPSGRRPDSGHFCPGHWVVTDPITAGMPPMCRTAEGDYQRPRMREQPSTVHGHFA
jgi:hypothetical protein